MIAFELVEVFRQLLDNKQPHNRYTYDTAE